MNPSPHARTDPHRNQLLAALSDSEWARWRPDLHPVSLSQHQVLCEAGGASAHVYFPTTAIVSLQNQTLAGTSAEIGVVGHEGVVGIALVMGGNTSSSRAVVQSPGHAYRLGAQALRREIERVGPVLFMLLRYTEALIAHVAQSAMCNRYHSIDQQLSRRLLQGLDRLACDELVMTHESAASLLGVRREGVTAAALRLQRAGVIRYHRGRIAVLDRKRLEQHACECYAVAKKEHERLLPMFNPHASPVPQAGEGAIAPASPRIRRKELG